MTKLKVNLEKICYIGLGSNLGKPLELLEQALKSLAVVHGVQLLATSSVFRTEPQGDTDQPWFFNQVAQISCSLGPHELLRELQKIETGLGRVRSERRFGPRSMDLDILLYGDMIINDAELAVPHPRMRERAFVLVPLAEIVPELTIPANGPDVKDNVIKIADMLEELQFTLSGDKIYQNL